MYGEKEGDKVMLTTAKTEAKSAQFAGATRGWTMVLRWRFTARSEWSRGEEK